MKSRKLLALVAGLAFLFAGCAASNLPKAAQVNQTITQVIADAGTVAILAEQQYQAGTIPQTAAARTAINDLGAAYEDAKQVYSAVLTAERVLTSATTTQLAACSPATANGVAQSAVNCQQATTAATAAKTAADATQANLTASVNALVTKTAAVKAITKK